ncbi:MAG: LLM class flavin-dependent oxidoreductase [Rhodospirillaceae bacterium]|nr:LLM class flavin-dependent oxidoreductase [Rhodospirillaceae bacterium]
MTVRLGYLLPTRERIMEGQPAVAPMLTLAEQAEGMGFDSLWVGDSLLARPRHEPMTLLAGVAGRVGRVELGTAVLLPALRNPVLLAHQAATVDQISEGRLILGVGIAGDIPNIRAEFAAAGVPFEKRVGRMMEGLRLCRALWSGEAVDWDGRWPVEQGVLAPTPHRPGGPPIWGGGSHPDGLARAGKFMDGWFPTGPDASGWADHWAQVQAAANAAGRDPADVTAAIYLTLCIDGDADAANARVNDYLERYYGVSAELLRRRQACFGGSASGAADFINGYINAGASHVILRFAGDAKRHMKTVMELRGDLAG